MLKRLGIPILAFAAMLCISPKPAEARIHFGVYLGGPSYYAPPPGPYYYSPYPAYPYYYAPYYSYPSYYRNRSFYPYGGYRGYYGRGTVVNRGYGRGYGNGRGRGHGGGHGHR